MTQGFWEDTKKQMRAEGYNNFSGYVQFLLKLRRELLHERRAEKAKEPDTDTSLFRLNESKPKTTK